MAAFPRRFLAHIGRPAKPEGGPKVSQLMGGFKGWLQQRGGFQRPSQHLTVIRLLHPPVDAADSVVVSVGGVALPGRSRWIPSREARKCGSQRQPRGQPESEERAVVHIGKLRRKFRGDPESSRWLQAVRCGGYRLATGVGRPGRAGMTDGQPGNRSVAIYPAGCYCPAVPSRFGCRGLQRVPGAQTGSSWTRPQSAVPEPAVAHVDHGFRARGGTTRTGQAACRTHFSLTEPSSIPDRPPLPRDPTTSIRASCERAMRVLTGPA